MKRRSTPEERYKCSLQKQQKILEDFVTRETEWAEDLIWWYSLNKLEIPADVYRACAFFINKEFTNKPGSLTLLYSMFRRCLDELPPVTRETAFDLLGFRFKTYAVTLKKGGYDGTAANW